MYQLIESGLALFAMLAAMLVLLEAGRRIGLHRLKHDEEGSGKGLGAMEGAVFGLMGLMVAFSFSGAASRFEVRRELILKESNAIGTAWLRLDLLPEPARGELRENFRRYVDARLAATRAGASQADATIAGLQQLIWTQAVAAVQASGPPGAAPVVLPAMNDMFDVATERYLATQTHPPPEIFAMLLGLALSCALLAGYGMAGRRTRSWLHILCFTGSLLLAIYVILDLEFPRKGFITVDHYDGQLVALRESMK